MATKIWRLLFLSACLASCSTPKEGEQSSSSTISQSGGEEMRVMHDEPIYKEIDAIPFDKSLWSEPEFFFDEELDNQGCKALFIRSDYANKESYAFAYLGLPEGELKDKPAILLLHGGGGTAYYEWVNAWKERGYVALAIDLEGHIPNKEGTINDVPNNLYHASNYVTPHNQNLGDENEDISLTWLHYACRTSIIANSFLHHFAGINPYKIGVCGVSWGGYITSIISGYDDRFAFAIPYYCITDMLDSFTPLGTYIKSHRSFEIFDNPEPLKYIETPFLYIGSNRDVYSNIEQASQIVSSMKNGHLSILNRFAHSHASALSSVEQFLFADNTLAKKGNISIKFVDSEHLSISLPEEKIIIAGEIFFTDDEEINQDTIWRYSSLDVEGLTTSKVISIKIRDGAVFYYASLTDEKGGVYTSKIEKI